jgi:competence protein ComEC
MFFPFLFPAISLAAGILLASLLEPPLALVVAGLAAALASAWSAYVLRKDRGCLAALLLAAVFLGMGLHSNADRDYSRNAVRRFDFNGYADFSGRLVKTPSFDIGRTYLQMKVENIRFLGREQKTEGNLRITVFHPGQYPSPLKILSGNRITVSAHILPVRDYRNFGEPRLANLRKVQNIHNHAVSKSALLVEVEKAGAAFSLRRLVSSVRLRLLGRIEEHFSSPGGTALSREGAVLEALLLGERGRMDDGTTESLQRSGLFHLIAISGAHIAIISLLLYSLLRLLRVPRRPADIFLIALLCIYALLVEGRASVFRAVIMTVVYLSGRLLWKKVNLLNTISFSAFLILLVNPFSLFDIGFELTFAATLAIILFYPRIVKFLPRLPGRIHELFALSVSAQLGVLPLIASSFHRVTFSSLLLNIPAIPLVGVIMGGGFLFLALSLVSATLAQLTAQALTLLIRAFLWISGFLNHVPALTTRLPGPHLATLIGYFLFLLLLLVRPRFKGQRLAALGLFAAFVAVLVTYPFPAAHSPFLKITFLDVGQGDSILVEFPGRKKMVVDGGGTPDGNFDIGEHVVSPFLWGKGIKKIDYLVLTHGHPDHMNGLVSLAANFKVGEFWEAFSPPENSAYRELRANLAAGVVMRRVFDGYGRQESGVTIEAIHPPPAEPFSREVTNEDSLVLRLTSDGVSFLLAADVETKAEGEITGRGRDVRSQVLKSPHHGSRTSSSVSFLEHVRPLVVVVTTGRGNPYGLPHPDILERYQAAGARVFRTDEAGAVEITAEGGILHVRTAASSGR